MKEGGFLFRRAGGSLSHLLITHHGAQHRAFF